MLTFEQMAVRLLVALALGALLGLERELVGKEAGIRTAMLVAGGAAIFSMIALNLPGLIALYPENAADIVAHNSGFLAIIANIVVGIGFIGAGIIIKTGDHVIGLTTAAVIWATAAVGVLAGLGITDFAVFAAFVLTGLLYVLRKARISEMLRGDSD